MIDLAAMQAALTSLGLGGWLLGDFRGSNVLARRVLRLPDGMQSRRWFYFVPARGEPTKLVHRIEQATLDHLPGRKLVYSRWQEFEGNLQMMVSGAGRVAMEYSPRNAIPYVARVDAGTVELIRSFGVEVESSGDLIQLFEAVWDDAQWAMHQEAAAVTEAAFGIAFGFIAERLRIDGEVRESRVQARILQHFADHHLVCSHPPIVAVGPHSGDPHYEPVAGKDAAIHGDEFVLVDLWGKLDRPRAVYSDLTQTGYTGDAIPSVFQQVFAVVAEARDAAIERVKAAFASGEDLRGWQVDRAARDVIERAGFGDYFVHRTGHSIGQETHGNGANMDDLETHDERRVLPRTCFSIEPGVYLPEFGVRSEVNVYIDEGGGVHVTGGEPQRALVNIV